MMKMVPLLGALLLLPAVALAQGAERCQQMIEHVSAQIPDLDTNPDAHEDLRLSEEQLQAVLATLDAARLVQDTDAQGCRDLARVAEGMLARGIARQ